MSNAAPMMPGERIVTLDIIRGFALLGILVMNLPGFSGSDLHLINEVDPNQPWWDAFAQQVRNVLFDGKFNSLFSFLFALGFTIQLRRLEEREPASALRIYLTRIVTLFLLGWLHGVLIWSGDILHMYAALGLVLLLIRNWSNRALAILLGISLLSGGMRSLLLTLYSPPEWNAMRLEFFKSRIEQSNAAFGNGSYLDTVMTNWQQMAAYYESWFTFNSTLAWYFVLLTSMILGLIAGRQRWIENPAAHSDIIRRIQWWSLGLGLAAAGAASAVIGKLTPGEPSMWWVTFRTTYALGRVLLMVFYLATIVRLCQHPRAQRWLRVFAPAGQMPLTNYLLQSVIFTFAFYAWGLGYWQSVDAAAELLIAFVTFFALQVPLSKWWLSRYRYGPMEYLWRVVTYGTRRAGSLRLV